MQQSYQEEKTLRQPLGDDEPLFFMHIPKTAGLSLISILDQRYVNDEICPLHDSYQKFLAYSAEEKARFLFVRGHFPYSLKDQLPRPPRLLTFLRDPTARVISAVNQLRRNEQQGDSFFKEQIGDMPLDEFLRHPVFGPVVRNVAVKYLNDIIGRDSERKKTMSLSLAKERLETFDVIGLVEQFDQSLELLAYTLGFPPILDSPRVNVDPNRSRRQAEIKQSTLDYIAETNRDEIELYEYGKKLFEQRVAQMKSEQTRAVLLSSAVPTDHVRFDFRFVDPGRGWYPAERHPAYGIVRWSGPSTTSFLRFNLSAGKSYQIRIKVIRAIARDVLNSLQITVNNHKIDLKMQRESQNSGFIFTGTIPAMAIPEDGETLIQLDVNRTVSPVDKDWKRVLKEKLGRPVNLDERLLGLLYNWIEIQPSS